MKSVYGKATTDAVNNFKNYIIMPLVLYVLFLGDMYELNEDIEEKNNTVIAFVKTMFISYSKLN